MVQNRSRLLVGLAVACLAGPIVSGQQVFRSAVEYVRLDVVVTDKQDRPVAGLTKDDFLVSENGTAQSLSTFEAVTIPTTRREITDPKTSAPSVDVVSNSAPPLGRQWVMIIDDLHIIESQERKLRTMVTEFLQRIPAEDQVAIVFVGRSDLSQGFTSDLGAQMRTVNRLRDALGQAYDATNSNGMPPNVYSGGGGAAKKRTIMTASEFADVAGATIDSNQSDRHRFAQATTDVLNNISRTLADSKYPRKAIVYVSEGATYDLNQTFSNNEFDLNREAEFARDYFDEMDKAFAIARHAGVPIYSIDPRGLTDASAVRGMADATIPGIQFQANNMRAIAENTGGLAFVGMSDVPRAVEALIHDNDVFYLLGFYPEPFVRDGKFHDVKVKIKGRDDVRVRARSGYSAPSAVALPPVDLAAAFNAAMAAALPESGISLRVFAAPVASNGRTVKTAVSLQITYPADAGKLNDTLDYAIVALDGDGKIKMSTRKKYEFSASPKNSGDVTFVINEVIDVPPQPLALRVGVASHHLGKIGVIHTAVEAAKPNSDNTELGGILLGYAGPPREDAKPKDALKGFVPFQPTTDRTFTSSDSLRIFAPVFWRGAAGPAPAASRAAVPAPMTLGGGGSATGVATVTLSIRQGAKILVERRDQVQPDVEPANMAEQSHASFVVTLPLKGVPPGDYILSITASASGKPAKREVAFAVR